MCVSELGLMCGLMLLMIIWCSGELGSLVSVMLIRLFIDVLN